MLCSLKQLALHRAPHRPSRRLFRPVVGPNGLEPSTSRLSGVRSNHLSYGPPSLVRPVAVFRSSVPLGGDDEVRTHDPLRARQVLSQLSYTPVFQKIPKDPQN